MALLDSKQLNPRLTGSFTLSGSMVGDSSSTGSFGNLNVFGNTQMDGNLTLGDNNKIISGAGSDLEIYHDGSNSFIDEKGTGDLFIRSNTVHIKGYSVNETMVKGIVNGAVELYHDNSKKLETTSAGVTVTGTISAGEVTATSDERLKSDIETIDNALDKVMNMRGVSFTKQAERGIGVIAQEVEKIIPEVVHDGEYKSVAYGNMVGVLIEAIKEQQKQIDELKKDK